MQAFDQRPQVIGLAATLGAGGGSQRSKLLRQMPASSELEPAGSSRVTSYSAEITWVWRAGACFVHLFHGEDDQSGWCGGLEQSV